LTASFQSFYHLSDHSIKPIKMSGRLDQSLDSIIDSQKKAKRDNQRRRKPTKPARAAPVGGVKKAVKPAKSAVKPGASVGGAAQPSKIVVSGLVSRNIPKHPQYIF
jgi:chemotaxis response regulator CheB